MLQAKRHAVAGDSRDARSGYPLGVLALRGMVTAQQHDAGLLYAARHAVAWGLRTPRSHLECFVASAGGGDGNNVAATREKLDEAVKAINSSRALSAIENIAVYERLPRFMDIDHRRTKGARQADERDRQALVYGLDVLVRLWGLK